MVAGSANAGDGEDLLNLARLGIYRVVLAPMVATNDLAAGLTQLWGQDTVLIVREDRTLSAREAAELVQCPHPLCFIPARRGEHWDFYHKGFDQGEAPVVSMGKDGDQFATGAYLGITCFKNYIQTMVRPSAQITNAGVGLHLALQAEGAKIPYHAHWGGR